ncbi:hypothetical protein EMCRGX_G032591 [Ephydatia muelleri]
MMANRKSLHLKPLHLARSMAELNAFVGSAQIAPAKQLCTFGEKSLLKAKTELLQGDEEMSYILFVKYLNVVDAVMKSEEYMYSSTEELDQLLNPLRLKEVREETEKLSRSLSNSPSNDCFIYYLIFPPQKNNGGEKLSPNLSVKIGDILQCKEEYLVHQCHCCDVAPVGGLAEKIFAWYPSSNIYLTRYKQSQRGIPLAPIIPGTVDLYKVVPDSFPSEPCLMNIVNLYAQMDPGHPSSDQASSPKPSTHVQEDTSSFRLELFNKCLSSLASMNLRSAFNQQKATLCYKLDIR